MTSREMTRLTGSATCLNSVLGYDDVAAIAKKALESGKISSEEFDKRVRPERECGFLSCISAHSRGDVVHGRSEISARTIEAGH